MKNKDEKIMMLSSLGMILISLLLWGLVIYFWHDELISSVCLFMALITTVITGLPISHRLVTGKWVAASNQEDSK